MIKGVALTETEEYIYKNDVTNPTKWKIGVIDSFMMSEIQDMITTFEIDRMGGPNSPAKNHLCLNMAQMEAVRYGLKGFENFVDSTGSVIPFQTEKRVIGGKSVSVITEEILRQIPHDILMELGRHILDKNKFSEEEVKN